MLQNLFRRKAPDSLEQNIIQAEDNYTLLNNVADIVQIVSINNTFIYVNKAWRTCFGYQGRLLNVLSPSDLIRPKVLKKVTSFFRQALNAEIVSNAEIEFVTTDNKVVFLEGSITPLYKNGKVYATLGIFRDVTMFKETTDALRHIDSQNREIRSALSDLMLLQSRGGKYLDVQANNENMLPCPVEELIGRNMKDILPVQVAKDLFKIFEEIIENKQTQTYEYELIINGNFRNFEARISYCEGKLLSLVRDVTERKKIIEAALAQQRLYNELIEAGHGYVITHDMQGSILSINRAAALSLGYLPEELLSYSFGKLFPKTDIESFENYLKQLKEKKSSNGTFKMLTKSGKERFWTYNNVLCENLGGGYYVLSHAQDITDLKRAEEEIRNLSLTDELTKLRNRRGFIILTEQQIKLVRKEALQSENEQSCLLLLFIDLDGLKAINDRYGHNEGDIAIIESAEVLKACFRDSDILARLGGDEFTVLIVDAKNESEDIIRERLNAQIEAANKRLHKPYRLSMSVGMVRIPSNSTASIDELVEYADMVMYEQKIAKKQALT